MNAGTLPQAAAAVAGSGPQTLPQWLLFNARERAALIGQRHKRAGIWKTFTWAEIAAITAEIAAGLSAQGVGRGDTVLLIGENRPELYWAQWAAMAIGARTVTMYPDATVAEMDYIAGDAQTVCVFAEDQEQVDKALQVRLARPEIRHVVYWEPGGLWNYQAAGLLALPALQERGREVLAADPQRIEREVAQGRAGDVALLSYTSGTTGNPKGVITTYASLLDAADRLHEVLAIAPESEYLSYIPLSWATEQWIGVTMGLMLPLRVNFAERPDQVQEAIRELAVEVLFFGPRQWESIAARVHARMIDAGPFRRAVFDWAMAAGRARNLAALAGREPSWPQRLRHALADRLVLAPLRDQLGLKGNEVAVTGGAAVAPEVFRLFAAMGVMLRNVYGCSEYGLIAAHVGRSYDPETTGSFLGLATRWAPQLEWRIGDDGELQVRGASGFAGYWGKPDKTAERFADGWYRTGDAVGLTEAGQLVYYDRVEHMSRLRGGQTYPKQFLEVRLRFSPYIREVMVIGDERHDQVSALINIDYDVFARWAEQRNIGFTTFTDLSQRPEIVQRVAAEIAALNESLPAHARVARFANLPKELDPDEGELTRTRKLKREFIEDRYRALIDALVAGARQVELDVPVRYQDGRQGRLHARVALADVTAEGGR